MDGEITRGVMRQLLQPKSRRWWAVVAGAFAVVAVFLAIEVFDLDGSALAHRLVQPPMAAPSGVGSAEGLIRSAPPNVSEGARAFVLTSPILLFHTRPWWGLPARFLSFRLFRVRARQTMRFAHRTPEDAPPVPALLAC